MREIYAIVNYFIINSLFPG